MREIPDEIPDLLAIAAARETLPSTAPDAEHLDVVGELVTLAAEVRAFARDSMIERIPPERWLVMADLFAQARRLCLMQVMQVPPPGLDTDTGGE